MCVLKETAMSFYKFITLTVPNKSQCRVFLECFPYILLYGHKIEPMMEQRWSPAFYYTTLYESLIHLNVLGWNRIDPHFLYVPINKHFSAFSHLPVTFSDIIRNSSIHESFGRRNTKNRKCMNIFFATKRTFYSYSWSVKSCRSCRIT